MIAERLERIEKLCEENHKIGMATRAIFESLKEEDENNYLSLEQDGYIKHLEEMLVKANRKIEKQKKKIKKLKREFEYVM